MRHIFFFLLQISLFVQAQNWEPIVSENIAHFSKGDSFVIKSIKIDSIQITGDTSFLNQFKTVEMEFNPQKKTWIGDAQMSLDSFVYYTVDEERSIKLNPYASIGDKWFAYYEDGVSVYGQVDSIGYEAIVDTFDSIKYISLTSLDDTLQLSISKNFGWNKLISFRDFSLSFDTMSVYELIGIEGIFGWGRIDLKDFYDITVGNEYHTYYSYSAYPEDNDYSEFKIEKIVDISGDTVVLELCGTKRQYAYSMYPHGAYYTYKGEQTLDTIVGSVFEDGLIGVSGEGYTGSYWYDSTEIFWFKDSVQIGTFNDIGYHATFVKGIGKVFMDNSGFEWGEYFKLVYTFTNDTIWGTPYECENLLYLELEEKLASNDDCLTCRLDGSIEVNTLENGVLKIYDLQGRLLQNNQISSNTIIPLSEQSESIVIPVFITESGKQFTSKCYNNK